MDEKQVFKNLLGLTRSWYVLSVEIDAQKHQVDVWIEHERSIVFACPECGKHCSIYDRAPERVLRRLNAFEHETFLHIRLPSYYRKFTQEDLRQVKVVTMDMRDPFIAATRAHVPNADETLKGTKYLWLWSQENMPEYRKGEFEELRSKDLKVCRTWAIKENLRHMWGCRYEKCMRDYFDKWSWWAIHSRLAPVKKAVATLKGHIDNIVTYAKHRITNALGESVNAKTEKTKRIACGFRNREHYKTAIYFHCGGLDLFPVPRRIRLYDGHRPKHNMWGLPTEKPGTPKKMIEMVLFLQPRWLLALSPNIPVLALALLGLRLCFGGTAQCRA